MSHHRRRHPNSCGASCKLCKPWKAYKARRLAIANRTTSRRQADGDGLRHSEAKRVLATTPHEDFDGTNA